MLVVGVRGTRDPMGIKVKTMKEHTHIAEETTRMHWSPRSIQIWLAENASDGHIKDKDHWDHHSLVSSTL